MKSKKILYCNQSMGMGGAEVFMTDLLVELQKNEYQIEVVTTRPEFAEHLKKHSLVVAKVPFIMDLIGNWKGLLKAIVFGPLSLVQWLLVLLSKLQAFPPKQTTLLVSDFNGKLLLTLLAKLFGYKVTWIQFSGLGSILDIWGGWVGGWFRFSSRLTDGIITSSEHSKKMILQDLPALKNKVQVIACGRNVKAEKFQENKSKEIVCVSRLQPGKGQDLLIKAMPAVLEQHPRATLNIVGEGDFEAELRALVDELSLTEVVTFSGRVVSIEKVLRKADVSVFPSVWQLEGFGLVLIEAMALAKPIVTFDRGPLNEIIQHQKNGLLAKSGSVSDLSAKINALLSDAALQRKLANQAAEDFEARYTGKHIAAKYDTYLTHHNR